MSYLLHEMCTTYSVVIFCLHGNSEWNIIHTCTLTCVPATFTSTAKLVRWVLLHCTTVLFSLCDTVTLVTPSVDHPPLPILKTQQKCKLVKCNSIVRQAWASAFWKPDAAGHSFRQDWSNDNKRPTQNIMLSVNNLILETTWRLHQCYACHSLRIIGPISLATPSQAVSHGHGQCYQCPHFSFTSYSCCTCTEC